MKIKNQKWMVGVATIAQNEFEIINTVNQSRIARINIKDFKNASEARKIADAIAAIPQLLKKQK